ncbi:LPXTG-motif cell wall-anchored protein [Sinobaca qinghaiensis]|uniref:LPXTG-motif cell wall-anchored protein n=1 Tax=Sinobaca qinghaiensis TaxID=342944 RepID=A0A419UZQ4_9BACL|nr:LPXTG cell wall anchor domain-containing protein [Sinobaca qinghaiensis]RKD71164.1 LPXTG-motif cell wall-anchored protein [Sinobaca qinghaiensis]
MLKKWIIGLSSVAVISLGSAGATEAGHGEDFDCDDFATHEDAVAHWDEHGYTVDNDPERLDGNDNDGIPCESLPGYDSTDGEQSESDDTTSEVTENDETPEEETVTSEAPAEEEVTEEGGALPETATANPMMMLFGALTAGAGAVLFIRRKVTQS